MIAYLYFFKTFKTDDWCLDSLTSLAFQLTSTQITWSCFKSPRSVLLFQLSTLRTIHLTMPIGSLFGYFYQAFSCCFEITCEIKSTKKARTWMRPKFPRQVSSLLRANTCLAPISRVSIHKTLLAIICTICMLNEV